MHTEIKTFEDACIKLGLDAATVLPDFSNYPAIHRMGMIAHAKLVIIRDALNDGWVPDWTNDKWDKWHNWFIMWDSSGSGFAFDGAVIRRAGSNAGSRLCFKSEAIASYAGKQFEDLFKEYFEIA